MQMFNRECGFTGTVLYFDLDVIITGPVDKFVDYHTDKFAICQDFNRKFIRDYPVSNSSVIRFPVNEYNAICEHFNSNWQQLTRQFRGDQDLVLMDVRTLK